MVDEATLAFWKYKKIGEAHDDKLVFETACEAKQVMEELEVLPVDELTEKTDALFSDWAVDRDSAGFHKARHGSFRVSSTKQMMLFDCLGMDEDDLNKIIDLFYEYSIGLYDPVLDERWDPLAF